MATISFEKLDSEFLSLTKNSNNQKARLFSEVSQFLIDFTKTSECNPELYTGLNSCDSVCMACVLDESIIKETKRVYACVEPFGKLTSGHMFSDWYDHLKREANVEIISNIDKEKFEKLFRLCVEE
jgi:inosine-uridine nucleoside N-ribohydrolase